MNPQEAILFIPVFLVPVLFGAGAQALATLLLVRRQRPAAALLVGGSTIALTLPEGAGLLFSFFINDGILGAFIFGSIVLSSIWMSAIPALTGIGKLPIVGYVGLHLTLGGLVGLAALVFSLSPGGTGSGLITLHPLQTGAVGTMAVVALCMIGWTFVGPGLLCMLAAIRDSGPPDEDAEEAW